jgi:hypothetical protein
MRRHAVALVLLLALVSCRQGFTDPTPGQSEPAQKTVELIAQNLRMLAGRENAIRFSFSPKDPSVQIRLDRSDPNGRVYACPLSHIDDPVPDGGPGCLLDLPAGVRESITAPGLGAIALVRVGAPITVSMRLEYAESQGRRIGIRFPVIPRPPGASVCRDNACNPFFEVNPPRGGSFSATARWSGGRGNLALIEGRVLAQSFTATGIPYRTVTERSGDSGISITGPMSAPSEYALTLVNQGAGDITAVEIDARWP